MTKAKTKVKRGKTIPRPGYEFVVACASCGQGMTYTDNGDDEWECVSTDAWTGQDSKHNDLLFCSETCVAEYYACRDDCIGRTAKELEKIGGEVGEKVERC